MEDKVVGASSATTSSVVDATSATSSSAVDAPSARSGRRGSRGAPAAGAASREPREASFRLSHRGVVGGLLPGLLRGALPAPPAPADLEVPAGRLAVGLAGRRAGRRGGLRQLRLGDEAARRSGGRDRRVRAEQGHGADQAGGAERVHDGKWRVAGRGEERRLEWRLRAMAGKRCLSEENCERGISVPDAARGVATVPVYCIVCTTGTRPSHSVPIRFRNVAGERVFVESCWHALASSGMSEGEGPLFWPMGQSKRQR